MNFLKTIRFSTQLRSALASLLSLSCAACGGGGGSGSATQVALRFAPKVQGIAFSCAKTFSGVGSTSATVSPIDLRFYISNVRLVSVSGEEVPVSLDQDGRWPYQDVAKLDFEDGSGTCTEGDSETNTTIRGTVPEGNYNALRFTLGVPFDLDHIDAATAPAPLNDSAMFWNWNFGYKFLKFDVSSPGLSDGFRVHIGSTECEDIAARQQQLLHSDHPSTPSACGHPNTVEVSLPNFNVSTDAVGLELGALLSAVNVNTNTPETAPGCMSEQNDPECTTIFATLGLPIGISGGGAQQLFFRE